MKKTVLFLFLSLVMVGCKDKSESNESGNAQRETSEIEQQECLSLEEYDPLQSIPEKAKWLQKYGKGVCIDTLYTTAIDTHLINDIKNYKISSANGVLIRTWKEINDSIKTFSVYSRYLSFDQDITTKNIKNTKIVTKFDTIVPCYSLALLRAIGKESNSDNTQFEFMNATKKGDTTIIIKVTVPPSSIKSSSVLYFNYSDEPRILDFGKRIISPL